MNKTAVPMNLVRDLDTTVERVTTLPSVSAKTKLVLEEAAALLADGPDDADDEMPLPTGLAAELSATEQMALMVIRSRVSAARPAEFEARGLGEYTPENPLIESLADRGLVAVHGEGIGLTPAGQVESLKLGVL